MTEAAQRYPQEIGNADLQDLTLLAPGIGTNLPEERCSYLVVFFAN